MEKSPEYKGKPDPSELKPKETPDIRADLGKAAVKGAGGK